MKNNKILALAFALSALVYSDLNAAGNVSESNKKAQPIKRGIADCAVPTSKSILDINNVRAMVLNSGDFWWDLQTAVYEGPKLSNQDKANGAVSRHSLFSGNLWIGGYDSGNNLLIAAHTYRQGSQVDFYAGPLAPNSGGITPEECSKFDTHFKINQSDIDRFIASFDSTGKPTDSIPDVIENWPGNINLPGRTGMYAPFFDKDNDAIYEPQNGEYPIYGLNKAGNSIIKPDQFIWWVQNDAGGAKTSTGTPKMYLEVQSTAFAFSTSNSLNNTTFYRHILINRSSNISLDSTFFGVNVDADLGYAFDDYVGCDVGKSLGICYNGDDEDDAAFSGYGLNPPSVGVDFFQGPKDDNGNVLGMAKFMYYNNDGSVRGNPGTALDFYRYLKGRWKDDTRMTYGGNGYSQSSTNFADYMFPGTTDPQLRPKWDEITESNAPYDRRFVESAGPFKFKPGQVQEVVIGVVWARADEGGATGSFNKLLVADNEAQELFDKEFVIADGPPTPDLEVVELDQKLILTLTNTKKTENYTDTISDRSKKVVVYTFEGYKIYQLANATVTATDLDNPDKAKEIAIVDLQNNFIQAFNEEYDPEVDRFLPRLKVKSNDKGIKHVFEIKEDLFNSNKPIVNHKPYFFTVVAYAKCDSSIEQYLQGRLNVITYTAIPHKNNVQGQGLILNSEFGDGPSITRISGAGNGGRFIDLEDDFRDSLLFNNINNGRVKLKYKKGFGPVDIKVLDPTKLPNDEFELTIFKNLKGWRLRNLKTGVIYNSDITDSLGDYEQVFSQFGFSITVKKVFGPGTNQKVDRENGVIPGRYEFKDPTNPWFRGMTSCIQAVNASTEGGLQCEWIANNQKKKGASYDQDIDQDRLDNWLNYLGRTFAPYYMLRFGSLGEAHGLAPFNNVNSPFSTTPNVDLVLTADKTKWSKCVVVEADNKSSAPVGRQFKGNLRLDSLPGMKQGMGMFPGYAINVETGQRLNVFFAEGSLQTAYNGADMLFNPTNDTTLANVVASKIPNGGKHYLYISNTPYDECDSIYKLLTKGGITANNPAERIKVYNNVGWATLALANPATFEEDLKNEVVVKLRAKQPYRNFPTAADSPVYRFDFKGLAPEKNNADALKTAMDLIGVVPNPYYGFSEYETSQIDSRVRIVNVPGNCTVSIYNSSGVLIRKISKSDDTRVFLDWDLKNDKGVPVASGVYIFNIRTTINGVPYDKVVKWFGVNRKIDLNSF